MGRKFSASVLSGTVPTSHCGRGATDTWRLNPVLWHTVLTGPPGQGLSQGQRRTVGTIAVKRLTQARSRPRAQSSECPGSEVAPVPLQSQERDEPWGWGKESNGWKSPESQLRKDRLLPEGDSLWSTNDNTSPWLHFKSYITLSHIQYLISPSQLRKILFLPPSFPPSLPTSFPPSPFPLLPSLCPSGGANLDSVVLSGSEFSYSRHVT